MTGGDPRRALVLRLGEHTLVVPTGELRALVDDVDAVGAIDLAAVLGTRAHAARAVGLVVALGGRRVTLRALADVEIADVSDVYQLPRLLADGGCAAWVRGLALVPGGAGEEPSVATWIDLPALARQHAADEITHDDHGESRERTP